MFFEKDFIGTLLGITIFLLIILKCILHFRYDKRMGKSNSLSSYLMLIPLMDDSVHKEEKRTINYIVASTYIFLAILIGRYIYYFQ